MSNIMRIVFKGLNILAWTILGIIAICIGIAYVTNHELSIIHNENPSAVSAAPAVVPAAPTADNKSGG